MVHKQTTILTKRLNIRLEQKNTNICKNSTFKGVSTNNEP